MRHLNTYCLLAVMISLCFISSARASTVQSTVNNHITVLDPSEATVQVGGPRKHVKKLHSAGVGKYAGSFALKRGHEIAFPFKIQMMGLINATCSWKGSKHTSVHIVAYPYDKVTFRKMRSPKTVTRIISIRDIQTNKKKYCVLVKNTSKTGIAYGKVELTTTNPLGHGGSPLIENKFKQALQKKRHNHLVQRFSVSPGSLGVKQFRFKSRFRGMISVEAHWAGSAKKLKFILDAPGGKDASQAGRTSKSPMIMRYKVKAKDCGGSNKWRLTIKVPKNKGGASGFVKITWPTPGK